MTRRGGNNFGTEPPKHAGKEGSRAVQNTGVPESAAVGDSQGQIRQDLGRFAVLSQESGDNLYRLMAMASTYSIGLEVVPIDGEHPSRTETLCRSHQRCIRQIHRTIRCTAP